MLPLIIVGMKHKIAKCIICRKFLNIAVIAKNILLINCEETGLFLFLSF